MLQSNAAGFQISKVFLTEYKSTFSTIRITTRDLSSPRAQELGELGAELRLFGDPVDSVLAGVNVVVSALPSAVPQAYKVELTEAIARQNVKVYFLSEYGQ